MTIRIKIDRCDMPEEGEDRIVEYTTEQQTKGVVTRNLTGRASGCRGSKFIGTIWINRKGTINEFRRVVEGLEGGKVRLSDWIERRF